MNIPVRPDSLSSKTDFIDNITENQPALADTLAITLDDDIRAVIKQGTKEKKQGKLLPLSRLLDK